jgi:hypothetical protein
MAPHLTIDRPAPTTGCRSITIRGNTTTDTDILVWGGARSQPTESAGNGDFYSTIELSPGSNVIRFQATNAYGYSQIEEVTVVYNQSQVPIAPPPPSGNPQPLNIMPGQNRVLKVEGLTPESGDNTNLFLTDGNSSLQALPARWDLWASASGQIVLGFPLPVVVHKIRIVGGAGCYPTSYSVWVTNEASPPPLPFFSNGWMRMPAPAGDGDDDIVPQAFVTANAMGLSIDWSACFWDGAVEIKEIEVYTMMRPEEVPLIPGGGC